MPSEPTADEIEQGRIDANAEQANGTAQPGGLNRAEDLANEYAAARVAAESAKKGK